LKIARFRVEEKERYGIVEDGKILSISTISPSIKCSAPQTIEELISLDPDILNTFKETFEDLEEKLKKGDVYKLDDVELLAPIVKPPKIICVGLNYRDHAAEQDVKIPEEPIIFMKPRTAITGPDKPIMKPEFVKQLDYEAELAVVIGKEGKNIPVEEAKHYVFGYTILDDVSARDIQFKDGQWTRGKSFDTFAPMGPYIITADQIENPNDLKIRTWVNGELRQDSSTKNMVFNVYEIIHHLSRVMTLERGDIIATGTPSGVGVFMKPEPKFLKPNDTITIEIEAIGKLENFVIEGS